MQPSLLDHCRIYLACLALFASLFGIYNLNFRHGSSVDTIPATAQPVSMLLEQNLDLNELQGVMSTNTNALNIAKIFGAIQERNGKLVSSYPIGAALLAAPFYALAYKTGFLSDWHHYRVVGKLAASCFVALSAVCIFLLLKNSLTISAALLISFLYGLGSTAWSTASQELWQHGPGMLCLAAACLLLSRLDHNERHALAFFAGLLLGLAAACRPLNSIPIASLGLYVLFHHRRYLFSFVIPLIFIGTALALHNWLTFENMSGGYAAIYQSPVHSWRNLSPTNVYSAPALQGLLNVWFSPSRGLFTLSPFLIFALFAFTSFTVNKRPFHYYLTLWFILISLLHAKNELWWGGATFGPRYFSEAGVALAILLGAAWPSIKRNRIKKLGFMLCGVISIAIHAVGAFNTPCGWEAKPVHVDKMPQRLWDWQNSEPLACLKDALINGPKAPEILYYQAGDKDF